MVTDAIAKVVSKLPDEYDVRARLFPAFLALVPVVAVAFGCYQVELKVNTAFTGLLAYLGVFFLFANICREFGKRHEARLFKKWGGKPSTQLLRHSNCIIDSITKGRYHRFLEKAITTPFTTASAEASSPVAADETYEGAVRWLLGKTRDKKKFSMLFQENIAYGFRRNSYGIRWIAIVTCVASIIWTLIVAQVLSRSGIDLAKVPEMMTGQVVSLVVALVALLIWAFFFTERTIRTASFSYADMLLRSCDSLPKKR
jgi:hypothetical protein